MAIDERRAVWHLKRVLSFLNKINAKSKTSDSSRRAYEKLWVRVARRHAMRALDALGSEE